ncbi:MAG: hypothetical protein HGA59_05100 [Chlorobiaceae bacterium]|nr:hypothetical protein [Chlorobiaceae bacterium]NTV16318.1 hypothetical protein [Chlorobiaceae bacterium]
MVSEPDLIPGIYIYCDRWCERCAFTSRCLQFRIEAEEREGGGEVLQNFDALNLQFWEEMGEALVQAMRLIKEFAVKEGIESKDLQNETVFSEPPQSLLRDAREHPCASAALLYSGMVNEWFAAAGELPESEESLLTHPPHLLEEPIQVIRHYQYFIYPKIVRAVEGRLSGEADSGCSLEADACGTAKVALIAIDRSLAAWSLLYRERPAEEDSTLEILVHLDRLRRSVEVVFPAARAFIRPGFDA